MATIRDGVAAWLDQEPPPPLTGLDERIDHAIVLTGLSPLQIEGQLVDGRWFYFRARHYRARLSVGATLDDAVDAMTAEPFITYGFHDDEWELAPQWITQLLDTAWR